MFQLSRMLFTVHTWTTKGLSLPDNTITNIRHYLYLSAAAAYQEIRPGRQPGVIEKTWLDGRSLEQVELILRVVTLA